jgi:hypothetical protein
MTATVAIPRVLGLRAGDLIEIRSEAEILSTLDRDGTLDGLPVMPEMLQHCGKQVRVFRRADKTCDTVKLTGSRRMTNAVHLEGLRCDGGYHGGCQAGCLIFWKEAWLKPVSRHGDAERPSPTSGPTRADLESLTTRPDPDSTHDRVFVCQATEVTRATTPLRWWDPRPYLRELWSGNVGLGTFIRVLAVSWFNGFQRLRNGTVYPSYHGFLQRTPSEQLHLQPGERVRVRSLPEIEATLSTTRRNRGLTFDREMICYCGGEYNVLRRVSRIINESTGKMMELPGECIILDGVTCRGHLSPGRLFCPRSIYPYWREVWLERVEQPVSERQDALAGVKRLGTPGPVA